MALCTPVLLGPVSELSTWLIVQGAAAGADVVISAVGANARDVAKQNHVSGGSNLLDLVPGEKLRASDLLVVSQTLGGEEAKTPPGLELGVQPIPASGAEVGPVGYGSHLFSCGEKVWVTGAVPGARVEVEFSSTSQGSDLAIPGGDAHIALAAQLPAREPVGTRQIVSGFAGPALKVIADPPPVSNHTAPAPIIQPCMACQDEILITGVIDGATVTVTLSSGPAHRWVSDASAMWMDVGLLAARDEVVARQDLPRCEVKGKDSRMTVGQTELNKLIVSPPCSGATRVEVS